MKPTLLLLACAVAIFTVFSAARISRKATPSAILQFIGAILLIMVVLAHVAEELKLLPEMGWGQSGTPGHYLDLVSAIGAVVLVIIAVPVRWFGTDGKGS